MSPLLKLCKGTYLGWWLPANRISVGLAMTLGAYIVSWLP